MRKNYISFTFVVNVFEVGHELIGSVAISYENSFNSLYLHGLYPTSFNVVFTGFPLNYEINEKKRNIFNGKSW